MWNKKDFERSKEDLIKIIKRDLANDKVLEDAVSMLSVSYGVPLIVIYEFIIEEMPEFTERSEAKIKALKEFYAIG